MLLCQGESFNLKKFPANTAEWISEQSVGATEAVKVIVFEWPHWPVTDNMTVYQVVVLQVNTSDGNIGKQATILSESSNFQGCNCFKKKKQQQLPPLRFCVVVHWHQHQQNKASGSNIPLRQPVQGHVSQPAQHLFPHVCDGKYGARH